MKISVDDQELFTLSEIQKKVIQSEIPSDLFEEDMKRRLQYILLHKYETCLDNLKKSWEGRLKERVKSLPCDDEVLAKLILAQTDYKDRATILAEEKSINDSKISEI